VASIDGVGFRLNSGSAFGGVGSPASWPVAWKKIIAAIAPSMRITLAIDQIPVPRGRRVADQRLVRPVAGVAQTGFARAVGRCRPGAPEEEGGQRLAVGHVRRTLAGIAYCSRNAFSEESVPKRSM
jgi:hypothetical protein